MARIHLLTANPASDVRAQGGYESLRESASLDRFKVHELVDGPEAADLILFAEIDVGRLCSVVLKHPYVNKFRKKCFMFSSDWRVIPYLPGVYTAVGRTTYLPRRVRPGFYSKCLINPLVKLETNVDRDLLYSFMGDTQTRPVRKVVAQLRHPRGDFVDTSAQSQAVMWRGTPEQRHVFWTRYVELARRSKFILCPRGIAPSSIRLFEAMCMGRVPVILSDEWIPPLGPAWDKCCVRIPESEAASVPAVLEKREAEAFDMGMAGRAEWETYFSQEVMFHRVVELCLEIQKARRLPEWLERQAIIPQLLKPNILREYLRLWLRPS